MITYEVVPKPITRGRYKHLIQIAIKMKEDQALRLSDVGSFREANAIRQAALRQGLRSLIKHEDEVWVVYLYKK